MNIDPTVEVLITGLKRAEQALSESEQRFRSLFENMAEGVAYCKLLFDGTEPKDFRYEQVNAAFEHLTGLKDVTGKLVSEVIPGIHQSNPGMLEIYGRVVLTGKPEKRETYIEPLGLWLSISLYSPQAEYCVAVFDDITERKHTEEALRKSEELHRSILKTAMDGFCVVDLDGRLLDVNEAYCLMSGYRTDELLTMSIADLETIETADGTVSHIQKIMAQGKDRFESRHRRKDGSVFDVEVSVQYRPTDGGRLVSFLRDLTDQKRAESESEKLRVQLAQAQRLESIGRLAGGVAHDFNNMLTVILGYARMTSQKLAPADPLQRYLAQIEKAGERSKDITQKLLGFSRQQVIAPAPANLNDLVEDLLGPLGRLIGEDIELSFFAGKDVWTVEVDSSQVNQMLLNLVVNARDAMPAGGKLTIETQNVRISEEYCQTRPEAIPGAFVSLSVSDTGPGIAPDILPKIFEPFFTTKGKDLGTGLGLSLVYGIAKQNGGFVNVYSELGQGTAFRIYFPRIAGEPAALQESGDLRIATTGSGKVLVVEDDALVRELVMASLESLGYTPLVATSPAEAIELCSSAEGSRIDLMLTDVVMPGMNGLELRDRISAMRPGIRVLFMSGYTSNVIVNHGILKPGVQFIQKPFSVDELSRRIVEVLNT